MRRIGLALVVWITGCDVPDYELVDEPITADAEDDTADAIAPVDTTEGDTGSPGDAEADAPPDVEPDAVDDLGDGDATLPDTAPDVVADTFVAPDGDACPSSMLLCGARCVDISSDPANCGDCDKACLAFGSCVSAVCKCLAPRTSVCSGACTDLTSDVDHCGSCAVKCATGQSCVSGHCK